MRPTNSDSDTKSTNSNLQDALESTIHPTPPPSLPTSTSAPRLDIANSDLISALEALQIINRSAYSQRLAHIATISLVLQSDPDTRNSFREHHGFLSAVAALASLDETEEDGGAGGKDADSRETREELRYDLASLVLQVISVACTSHDLNRATFSESVGYAAVGEAIKLSGLMNDQPGAQPTPVTPTQATPAERLLSILYSYLTADFSSPPLFSQIRRHINESEEIINIPLTPPSLHSDDDSPHGPTTPPTRSQRITWYLRNRSEALQGPDQEVVENPEIVPLMLELEASLGEEQTELRFAVLAALLQLSTSSRRSQVALNSAGVVGIALERLFPEKEIGEKEGESGETEEGRKTLRKLTENLLEMGAGTKETRKMFQSVVEGWKSTEGGEEKINNDMLSLILYGVRKSRYPSFIHFDLSRHGHSSLTLRSLGRQFPPPTHGYTYLAWISIEQPPSTEDERLIIFGCGDATGKCHVEICITPDLQLSLATSLTKPIIVFSNFTFETGQFYHLAVVHQRPKYSSSSPVAVYVDGKLVETQKVTYPVAPPKDWEVQGWLGTPKERVPAGRLEKGKSELKWDLGPTWLIHGDVPEEMIVVCSTLSPRYACNFQDQLGQFQTNATSTQLNLRIDEAARKSPKGTKNNSPLVYAIRDKGSAVIPEHRIIFAFTALNVLVAGSGRGLSSSGLSAHGQQALGLATRARGKCIVNSAIPQIEEALVQPHGLGHLEGEPCIANPKGLDVAIWKIGGVPVALRLVELANTPEQLTQAIQLFVELISHSWRNSEDTERVQGYEILALHLKAKPGLINVEAHDVILAFVGFDFENPELSVVSNPLAFRFLVLDLGLWSTTEEEVQLAHFCQLKGFLEGSQHNEFNTRRLAKMHITRKLLYALRAGYFASSMLAEVVKLLLIVVRAHFTTECVRHIATFLTATICQVADGTPRRTPLASTTPRIPRQSLGTTPPINGIDPSTSFVLDASAVDVGSTRAPLEILLGLHDLLLAPEADHQLAKFGKVITAKWSLLFLLDETAHPFAAVLSLRILVRLLQTQGSAFVSKFTNTLDGFSIMRAAIPHLWQYGQIHLALFSLLHGHDISTIALDAPFASATFALSSTEVSPVAPEVARIIIAAIAEGVKSLPATQDDAVVVDVPAVAVTAPDASEPEETSSTQSIPLSVGFETLLDILSQTSRAVGSSQHLVDGPAPLQDLALALLPFVRLPSSNESRPAGSSTPAFPVLSAQAGYRVRRPSTASDFKRPIPASPTVKRRDPPAELRLQIPTIITSSSDILASPLTNFDGGRGDLGLSTNREATEVRVAAVSVIKFLAHQVEHQITSRHFHRHTGSGVDPASSPSTDPCLHTLRQTFESAAPGGIQEQVAYRTLILGDVLRRLARAGTAPLVSSRVASLVSFSVDLAYEGWLADLEGLLEFILGYLEKLLDDAVLASPSPHSGPLNNLFKSLDRIILLALYKPRSEATTKVLKLLVRHQLTTFSSNNTDAEFFRCLIQRLHHMLRNSNSSDDVPDIVDFFKLLILQRPKEVEMSLIQRRQHASEAPVLEKLIDTDYSDFVLLLQTHQEQLDELKNSWDAFVDDEGVRARRSVESELFRLGELSKSANNRMDASRRRTRKQRGSIYDWSGGIHEVEATRVAHTRQDIADLSAFIQTEWSNQTTNLQRECAIWGGSVNDRQWTLDFTEGHHRMRKKLLAVVTKKPRQARSPVQSKKENHSRSLGATRLDSFSSAPKQLQLDDSTSPLGSPPFSKDEENIWAETPNESSNPASAEIEDSYEDKNRKVRRSLDPGDVIKSVFNVNRIVGLDACAGLLLLAKKNVYVIDNFFQKANGDLVDAWDAPAEERDQHLQTLSDLAGRDSHRRVADLDTAHRSRRWTWSDLIEVHERKYLFRDVALELFFADGRSFLLTFSRDQRNYAHALLGEFAPSAVAFGSLNVTGSSFGSKVQDVVMGQRTKLERMTKRWERREVSNFEYLMFLNTSAGRTYNDLTNYPVFPWILADYTSDTLDLTADASFRDLSKPMGAQSDERKVSYLLRLRPFTESYLDLQGGSFDHADRMFWSISKAWDSCSKQSRSDVRELIPEFYYLPDFLVNSNKLDLGDSQYNSQQLKSCIDDVELPPWAKGDPRLFVELHRQALESEYVSQHLGEWIDLIFGYRQTGEPAVESCNVFHHLSYEGAIGKSFASVSVLVRSWKSYSNLSDLDAIVDADERKAATSTIHNFGMTPRQLFSKPHPLRVAPLVAKATHPLFCPNLLVEDQAITLIQSIIPVFEIPQQVSTIYITPGAPDKTVATATQTLFVPDASNDHLISWGFADATVRLHAKNNNLPTSLFENMHSEFVSAACFADPRTFVTASTDTTVSLWRWRWRSNGKEGHFQQLECLRGHSDQVTCVAASRANSIVVSGSDDKTAIIWDLNRNRLVHCLEHDERVNLVAVVCLLEMF
ncbi:hypothetical protein P7C70_g4583, partial [Phenoliferia sp. Uapishka_3]